LVSGGNPILGHTCRKNNGAPVKIVLVQQLSSFQRAPQGYLKELFDSK
jgi:hypothetical protein